MDLRTYGVGAQILKRAGCRDRMKLLGSPRRMPSMTGYGLEVTGFLASSADLLKDRGPRCKTLNKSASASGFLRALRSTAAT